MMATLGGLDSIFGGILGALAVTFAIDALRVIPKAQPIIFGLALLLLVRFLPSGIAGVITALIKRERSRHGGGAMGIPATPSEARVGSVK
jgi:branched-chain amino acid transport system permease protein